MILKLYMGENLEDKVLSPAEQSEMNRKTIIEMSSKNSRGQSGPDVYKDGKLQRSGIQTSTPTFPNHKYFVDFTKRIITYFDKEVKF